MTGPATVDTRPSLTTGQLAAFGFPAMTHAFVAFPLYSILPTFYAANTAVTLAQIGLIAAISRIIDAVNDPVIGHLSDRTRSRFGSRKPWMIGAIIFCAAAITSLFSPPATATWLYFLLWSQILYTGFTMFEVPRAAWSVEVSRDYHERTKVNTAVALFNVAGSLSFFAYPLIASRFTGSSEITGDTLHGIALIYLVVMPIGILASLKFVPIGDRVSDKQTSYKDVLRSALALKPVRIFFAITMVAGIGNGVVLGVTYIFYSDYMGLGAYFTIVMATLLVSEILFLPLWVRILKRVDRHKAWGACLVLLAVTAPLVLLVPKGPGGLIFMLPLVMLRALFFAPINFLPTAVLGDVIDYDSLKTGQNKAGNLFALQMILLKIAMAIGSALAFLIIDFAGFKLGQENSSAANMGLLVAYLGIPFLTHPIAAAICWRFPIDRSRHHVIQRRLARRTAG